jgi:hypothetical protein
MKQEDKSPPPVPFRPAEGGTLERKISKNQSTTSITLTAGILSANGKQLPQQ